MGFSTCKTFEKEDQHLKKNVKNRPGSKCSKSDCLAIVPEIKLMLEKHSGLGSRGFIQDSRKF